MPLAPLVAALLLAGPAAPSASWRTLEPGLEYGIFDGPPGVAGDGKIAVVRVDPQIFDLRLLNASAPGQGAPLSARSWAARAGASAVINAGMYQEDYRTAVSLMRTRDHVNQRRISKDKTALLFDRLEARVPPARMVDRDCDDLEAAATSYGTVIQSIRLLSCEGKNVWAPSDRRWSIAAVGVDGAGRVLFLHAQSPWPVHEFVNALLALPIDLRRAMYLEGGPEAQLFARGGGVEVERLGAFTGPQAALTREGWPVPNVIAAVRRRR